MPGVAQKILEVLEERGALAPGDVVSITGEPRYRVLAAFHCLEELGLIDKMYERGTYKIYQVTVLGKELLRQAKGHGLAYALEKVLLDSSSVAGVQLSTET
ncbi:MAG: hypothetical protein F7C38_05610 [Desulfurococcales archaeon]|nr:hypothetical protein [Desulfurococcales archaeon]